MKYIDDIYYLDLVLATLVALPMIHLNYTTELYSKSKDQNFT